MPNMNQIPDLMSQITDDIRSIVSDEIALAKAELKPAVKRAGIGGGLLGVAAYFVITAATVLWFLVAAGFAWIYSNTGLSAYGCVFFGILSAIVVLLIIAGGLALAARKSFSGITGLRRTPATADEAMSAVRLGVAEGQQRVAVEIGEAPDYTPAIAPGDPDYR